MERDLAALRRQVGFGADDEALVRALREQLWPPGQPADLGSPVSHAREAPGGSWASEPPAGPPPPLAGAAGEDGSAAAPRRANEAAGNMAETLTGTWWAMMSSGRWDAARVEHRRSLGRRFASQGSGVLPVLLAAGRIRRELVEAVAPSEDELSRHELRAVERLVDVELALVLQGFEADVRERATRQERAAALGALSASIAHELRNPLGVIDSSVFLLQKLVRDEPKAAAHLDRIAGQVRLSSRIIDGLMELVRGIPPGEPATELRPAIDAAAEGIPLPPGSRLEVEVPPDVPKVGIEPHQLRQILVNLIGNAADALSEGGRVLVEARPEADSIALRVSDTGAGVDPEIRDRIFEPLVTAKSGGVGLGLALCRSLAERHGGSIDLGPSVLGGATFVVRLPVRR
ncbi:MAG TPA: HAMP domain-containing sensor histidine kinase [Vulgatibacter sp.]